MVESKKSPPASRSTATDRPVRMNCMDDAFLDMKLPVRLRYLQLRIAQAAVLSVGSPGSRRREVMRPAAQ